MVNVLDYIDRYCKERKFGDYVIKSNVITKPDFGIVHRFAPSIAFFYRVEIDGIIQNVTNLERNLLNVSTATDHWDFSRICTINDNGTIQHATSDFIFVADNMMNIELLEGDNAVFQTVYGARMFYISVFPETAEKHVNDKQQIQVDIKENQNFK